MSMRWLVLVLVLLSSCRGGSDSPSDTVLQEGKDGLTIALSEQIPEAVFPGDLLPLIVDLRNEGFSDIVGGVLVADHERDILTIEGWDLPDAMRENGDHAVFTLEGKNLAATQGERAIATALLRARDVAQNRERLVTPVGVTACYRYFTVYSDTLCLDTDPIDTGLIPKSCDATDLSASSQGAPVAITLVELTVLPSADRDDVGFQLTIHAKNVGGGLITAPGATEAICLGQDAGPDAIGPLLLSRIAFSNYEYTPDYTAELDCTPNPTRERDGEYVFRCRTTEGNGLSRQRGSFETPLVIELAYGYRQRTTVQIDVLGETFK